MRNYGTGAPGPTVDRVTRFRTPRLLDAVLTLACIAGMYLEIHLRNLSPSAADQIWIVLASLPVLLRRQVPGISLALAFAGLFGIAENDGGFYQAIPGPAVVCAYAVASRHGRWASLLAAAAGAPITLAILQIYSPHPLFSWPTAQNLALVPLPLALGLAAHDRRAYTAALVERAQTAERNQEETAMRRVSEERLRIARDVHDVVAHAMVTINVQAGVGAYLVHNDPDEAHTALRTIKQISGDSLADLRSMLGLLREPTSGEPGPPVQGVAAIDDLAESVRTAGMDLVVDIDPAARHLPTSVDTTAFRIVQESLTNTLRHAGPTKARITLTHEESQVRVEITDDGGTPAETRLSASGSGNGLRGMRERAAAIGGSLTAGSRTGGGWQVVALLPTSEKS